MKSAAALLLLFMLVCGGCAASPDAIVFSQSLRGSVDPWYHEACRRFNNPVMVVGHGGRVDGVWCIWPDDGWGNPTLVPIPMEWVAIQARERYPGRPIVIIACNRDHDAVDVADVWYATDIVCVWPIPWRADWITSIDDFVSNR